ncbi:sugar ABC transporter ATP-binding protein [Mesobaculum littorinae]|uniref:Sugar ABC transporter ATP-binding protein n=1 Tax=Mesobaculum littorinae TaxID=2486419 RepID=A0A438AEH1_9RHOB|nr:sugar ABC transporter ATP-binding protein [Mesobaculum littorinae]RVV97084.1 sugar ABC transporter ATP-binding protein [Mesobaculum littorinae]
MTAPAIEMRDIDKHFGPVHALDKADLVVAPGTVHGLVGQNGAGKSTIIKVLAGIYRRTGGTVRVFGEQIEQITPAVIEAKGVHFIHQDRLLVPSATVAESVFLRNEPRVGPFLEHRTMRRRAQELLKTHFNLDLDPGTLVQDLSTAQQKIVQITRALANDARVLVLDEPTAALVKKEVDNLFEVLRRLRDDGLAIIFISHYMSEISEICDTVTVLRNGTDVGVVDPREVGIQRIVDMMTNRDTSEMYPPRDVTHGEVVLEMRDATAEPHFRNVSLTLREGEILGLTGLLGSGDKEVMNALFGQIPLDSGEILLRGKPLRMRSPVDAVGQGFAKIPEDRRAHGVATALSVRENISLASLLSMSKRGLVSRKDEARVVDDLIADLGIKTPGRDQLVKNLSGGNQQKVVVAKWLSCESEVYLMDEPTVAVDVGAKIEIFTLMNRLAAEGKSMIFLSSDLEEIVEMCDRTLVIYRGELIGEYAKGDIDADRLLAAASGAASDETPKERSTA